MLILFITPNYEVYSFIIIFLLMPFLLSIMPIFIYWLLQEWNQDVDFDHCVQIITEECYIHRQHRQLYHKWFYLREIPSYNSANWLGIKINYGLITLYFDRWVTRLVYVNFSVPLLTFLQFALKPMHHLIFITISLIFLLL